MANWLINRAMKTPYQHIPSADNTAIYMGRWWLFNAYKPDYTRPIPWLPSIRVHHIQLPDNDRHEHDHPWDARTIILRGGYIEERRVNGLPTRHLNAGDTAKIGAGMYHRIAWLAPGGAWTLFITFRAVEDWGYWVGGEKVNHKDYIKGAME